MVERRGAKLIVLRPRFVLVRWRNRPRPEQPECKSARADQHRRKDDGDPKHLVAILPAPPGTNDLGHARAAAAAEREQHRDECAYGDNDENDLGPAHWSSSRLRSVCSASRVARLPPARQP